MINYNVRHHSFYMLGYIIALIYANGVYSTSHSFSHISSRSDCQMTSNISNPRVLIRMCMQLSSTENYSIYLYVNSLHEAIVCFNV